MPRILIRDLHTLVPMVDGRRAIHGVDERRLFHRANEIAARLVRAARA